MITTQRSMNGDGLQSPRSNSSSSPYLTVSVTDPAKMGNGVQAYISYKVITKTNFPEYQGPEKIVIRRYSDFVWLRDRIFEKYKGIFIPPLPEKSTVEKFRFSAEFIEMRRQALDTFVNRIALHHELQQSDDLRIFLEADEQTMERARSQETGYFKKKPSDLMQIFRDVQSKVSDVVLGKEKPVEETNPEYEKLKRYIFELEDHLAEAQKHAYRLVKRHRELGQSLAEFGKAIKLLGACEGDALGNAFSELGAKSEMLSIKLQREAHHLLMNFEEPLKDYVRAVQSVKGTIAERANAFRQQCELAETIKLKEIDLNKLRLIRSEKMLDAEHEYEELKADGEDATRRFETIVRLMNEEIVRFQDQKTQDMGLAFHEFAKGQVRLSNAMATICSRQLFLQTKGVVSPKQSFSSNQVNPQFRFADSSKSYGSKLVLDRELSGCVVSRATPANNSITPAGDDEGVSLGTMKLPMNTDLDRFETLLFQWANSMSQGAQLPLPMPLKVDKIKGGVRLGFITIGDGVTEVPVYIDCLVFPAVAGSTPFFRAVRDGPKKDQSPPGEPRIMKSLLAALKKDGPKKDQSPPGEARIMKSLLAALKKSVEIAAL
nr:sorting nexin 1 [Tanacetum cinerariifolium]